MNTQQYVQVNTTCDQQQVLESIAQRLVDDRLAACVQISGPATSVYRWQGQRETAREWLCTIKTAARLVEQVQQVIRAEHSYDEPEILVTPVVGGSDSYLKWLADQLR